MRAAEPAQRRDDVVRNRARVEPRPPRAPDHPQGRGERRLPVDVALGRRLVAGQEHGGGLRQPPEAGRVAAPIEGDTGRDRVAVLGSLRGRFEERREIKLAVIAVQPQPGVDRAWDGDGERRDVLDDGNAVLGREFERGGRGRAAGAVERHRLLARPLNDGEAIAPDAGHAGLDHAEKRGRGDRGVDRAAAAPQISTPRSEASGWEVAIIARAP